jgi:hypothetical protein
MKKLGAHPDDRELILSNVSSRPAQRRLALRVVLEAEVAEPWFIAARPELTPQILARNGSNP